MATKPRTAVKGPPAKGRPGAPVRRRYEAFLGHLTEKGRAMLDKHDQAQETLDPACGETWRRLAGQMGELAPHPAEVKAIGAVQFYIPDGKYRQQVFALEQTRGDSLAVYIPDVLAAAIARKILAPGKTPGVFRVPGKGAAEIRLELITADTQDLTVCKPMVGWGRRALRAEVTAAEATGADGETIRYALEALCRLAAEQWGPR